MIRWTPAMDAAVLDGVAAKRTYLAIAADLNATKNAVSGRLKRLRNADAPTEPRKPREQRKPAPRAIQSPPPRVDRDPCWRCGVRADVGCVHSRSVA